MSSLTDFSVNYLNFNSLQAKNLVLVVQIDGVDLLSSNDVYTRVRYGDPQINYGQSGLVYGGLRKLGGTRSIVALDSSSLTISQKNEPEQGRASISQLSIGFIDKNGYMTQVVSPGVIVPEIVGRSVTCYLGYQQISYPEDYLRIFRGTITDITVIPSLVTLQFSDPNATRRQQVFYSAQTILTEDILATDTAIPLGSTADFPVSIIGPDGTYDIPNPWNPDGTHNVLATKQTGVRTFAQIDSEWIEYGPLGLSTVNFAIVQTILYQQVNSALGVTIIYIGGGTAGSEVVSVAIGTNQLSVQIQSGVSTAAQVIAAVNSSPISNVLISGSLYTANGGISSTPQITFSSAVSFSPGLPTVLRGTRGTTAGTHSAGTTVMTAIQFQDNALIIALKTMLSGWDGPWLTGVPVYSFRQTFDPVLMDQESAIILPDKVDAIGTYGLAQGDYISITGATNSGNNITNATIVRFADLFLEPNRIIYVTSPLVSEFPTSAVMSFRSQYDTYPTSCGVALTNQDVDIQGHLDIMNGYINGPQNDLRFFLTAPDTLKTFLEAQVYLATATYSLTKRGKLSVGFTKPPIADELLVILDQTNIVDPQNIVVNRGLNNRKFYNEIDWDYDYDDTGTATSFYVALDVDSVSQIGVSSILPIQTTGVRTDLGSVPAIVQRASFLLNRYKRGAVMISLKVNWGAGCLIESGDTVAIKDDGTLFISNFQTGLRDLGVQLFEVLERALDIRNGNSQLTLIGGLGADATDRYATISPSSVIVSGSNSMLLFKDSYGEIYPGDEIRKWQQYVGQPIQIHDINYTYVATTNLIGLDPSNDYRMFIDGLSSPPPGGIYNGLIIDIVDYPDSTLKTEDSLYKQIHAFISPQVQIVSGADQSNFDVSSGDVGKFFVGSHVYIHLFDWSVTSGEQIVSAITGTTITITGKMGFVPDNTYYVDGIGFPDKQGAYRYI